MVVKSPLGFDSCPDDGGTLFHLSFVPKGFVKAEPDSEPLKNFMLVDFGEYYIYIL